jgi:hypothetical protein
MMILIISILLVFYFSCDVAQTGSTNSSGGVLPADSMIFEKFQKGVFPTVNYSDSIDTMVLITSPNSNYGASTVGAIGTYSGNIYRYLIRFNIKGYIPNIAKVSKAYLLLYMLANPTTETGSSKCVYALTRNFIEGTSNVDIIDGATWSTYDGTNAWTTPGGDLNSTLISNSLFVSGLVATDYYTFQLDAEAVQGWINDSSSNHGMIIKNVSEGSFAQASVLRSNEYATLVDRPMLIVYYSLP